ncbi:lipase family protein [Thalassomonas actiniarum]|uniref:Lipase family protein n=1 Tax=Thalassomonas actiniarum TaxID=485447 RepID=A0AAE9YTA5_9GAMM|nr:lipase family protein [Thalassomonas actiniarum]WDE00820.1 lipase family protein [Thalassomonas actiniarum]
MSAISPRVASNLALVSYEVREALPKAYNLKLEPETKQHFTFDLSKHVYKGSSGGFFWRQETGFALIGQGKSQQHAQDHVIAIRGTATLADALTDVTCHSTNSDTGKSVHTGFQSCFASMRPGLYSYLNQTENRRKQGIIHCVGHSLGGALAALTADWIKTEFDKTVYLYTFGAPRVGKKDFANSSSARVDKMFRCVHGADPVPKVPVWPFYHAPLNGNEYLLSRAQGMDHNAHSLRAGPGYTNTADHSDWENLYQQAATSLSQRVVLNYQNRIQTTYSTHWADKIAAALMTVLIDGGAAAIIASLQVAGTAIGTVYDIMARTLVDIVKVADKLKEQVKGLLGHMLVFAGRGAHITIEFTEKFIRWVFTVTISRLNKAARQALKQN